MSLDTTYNSRQKHISQTISPIQRRFFLCSLLRFQWSFIYCGTFQFVTLQFCWFLFVAWFWPFCFACLFVFYWCKFGWWVKSLTWIYLGVQHLLVFICLIWYPELNWSSWQKTLRLLAIFSSIFLIDVGLLFLLLPLLDYVDCRICWAASLCYGRDCFSGCALLSNHPCILFGQNTGSFCTISRLLWFILKEKPQIQPSLHTLFLRPRFLESSNILVSPGFFGGWLTTYFLPFLLSVSIQKKLARPPLMIHPVSSIVLESVVFDCLISSQNYLFLEISNTASW